MESTQAQVDRYIFETDVEWVSGDSRRFKLVDLQGMFHVEHTLQPLDRVRVTVERVVDEDVQKPVSEELPNSPRPPGDEVQGS